MSLRYKADFLSETNKNYIINIFDEDSSASAQEFCTGPDGFTISWEGQIDNIWQEIVPSKCEFDFIIEDQDGEDFIFECATGTPNRFKVYIESVGITPTLIWQGYLQGEGIEIEDEDWPTAVRLGCTDLGYLDDLPYMLSGSPITGEQSITDTILNVLEIAGHKEFYDDGVHSHQRVLATSVDWWSENMASPVSGLNDAARMTRVNQSIFYKGKGTVNEVTCKQVIEDCCRLFGCRFFQSAGLFGSVFNFVQIDDYEDGTLRTTWYNTNGTQNAFTNYLADVEVDRVNIFQHGGRTSIVPGVKYALRDYKLQRNYLENVTADQDNPLDVTFGEVWPTNNAWQIITLKFNIRYKILDLPDISPNAWFDYNWNERWVALKPLFRLILDFDDLSTNSKSYTWSYAYIDTAATAPGVKLDGTAGLINLYRDKMLGSYIWAQSYNVKQEWVDNAVAGAEVKYYEIIHDVATIIDKDESEAGTYIPNEISIPVEFTTNVPTGVAAGVIDGLRIRLDLADLFNSHNPQWLSMFPSVDILDYVEWSVNDFEMIVHSGAVEENPQTGIKYRGTSPDAYRRTETLSNAGIVNYDSRALNGIKILDTVGQYAYDELWYRGTDDTDLLDLNKMSVREAIAMTKRGLYFWQGKIIDRGPGNLDNLKFLRSVELRGVRHIIIQAKWEARMNEWSSIYLLEVARNQTGITIEEYNSETSSSKAGGNSAFSPGGGGGASSQPPQYEFASGITASAYGPDIILESYASASDDAINTNLWIFQDATKLHYPTGYDIDFVNNLIIPTYEFEDSNIELYLFP